MLSARKISYILLLPFLVITASACTSTMTASPADRESDRAVASAPANEQQAPPAAIQEVPRPVTNPGQLPVRFQRPSYLLPDDLAPAASLPAEQELAGFPVGADISSGAGPVPLREVLRQLAGMKNMNISWASDVDQYIRVEVDIRADDDFFGAITELLRQVDYYPEVRHNTIVVRYRETRSFHLAMPFMASTYNTGVGGDVLGAGGIGGGSGSLVGNIQLTSNDNRFDIWDNIRKNMDQLLEIWEETIQTGSTENGEGGSTVTRRNVQGGRGYYTIDKPIGLITVTAPRPLMETIATYLDNLKAQLFRQISIEAKIIEVNLDESAKTGIDWRGVLSGKRLDFEVFGPQGIIYSTDRSQTTRAITRVATGPNPFQLLLDAIAEQGTTNVLANPRISVMNGQPALITVGETFRYISEVATTVSDGGVSTSVSTDTVMSGLGLAVLPTITDNNEIVLSLTPVTSKLSEPMDERVFQGLTVQLPQINIRELKTIVKVRDGDTLLIGGLIDSVDDTSSAKVPVLGDVPGLGRLFRHDTKVKQKKELVILLQPTII